MQEGSLVECTLDMTPFVEKTLFQLSGITPKPNIVFTCEEVFKNNNGNMCIKVVECELIAMRFNTSEEFRDGDFKADIWRELAPPEAIELDELMPESAFAHVEKNPRYNDYGTKLRNYSNNLHTN